MRSLRTRLVLLFLVLALSVVGVILLAVIRFSADQVMHLIMEGVATPEEAQAMFDAYVLRVLLIGAAVGIILGGLAAWWLVLRLLHPIQQLTEATRSLTAGDLSARVSEPPEEELKRLARSFNHMAETLERVESLRRVLVEDVAHELRTPLTSLLGYTEALADGVVAPTPELLQSVHEEIDRLRRLVDGLDQLARGDRATRERARVEIDLETLIQRAVGLLAPELERRRINVRVESTGDLPLLLAEPDGIGQVVSNLLQNAARYTDDGGDILIRLNTNDERLRCSIENSGPTIPPADLPLIWERLYRVDPSRTRASGGAGIGLAIVRQIVVAHGGSVGATSEDGRTAIWFRMPAGSA